MKLRRPRTCLTAGLALMVGVTAVLAIDAAWPQARSSVNGFPWRWDDARWALQTLSVPPAQRADGVASVAAAAIEGRAYPGVLTPSSPSAAGLDFSSDIVLTYAYLRATPTRRPIHLRWRSIKAPSPELWPAPVIRNDQDVASAIATASMATGIAPAYLWRIAYRESGLRPGAFAQTSTALGLYQFLRSTWLSGVKQYGAILGLGRAAAAISIDPRGRARATDPGDEENLLALRSDPLASSAIAAALTADNARRLATVLGRAPSMGQLYLAHVLGVEGAVTLERAARTAPFLPAAPLLPVAANANRALFFTEGRPRSASAVLSELERRGSS